MISRDEDYWASTGVSLSCLMLVGFVCHIFFTSGLINWMRRAFPLPSFTTAPLTTWGEGVRFAVFGGGGSSPLLLEDLPIGNIGESCNEPSEEF